MLNGAVTILDVLGWKGIWQRKPDAMLVLKGIRDLIGDIQEPASKTSIWGFSDTIVLATHGEPKAVLPVHVKNADLLLSFCLDEKLPIRGAIGYGQFSSMDNMLIGPAVDEVASWYEAVEWIGAILTPSASFNYRGEDYPEDSVLEYSVPIKKEGRYTMKCVNWFGAVTDEEELLRMLHATASIVTPDVAPKYLNTVEFFRHIRKPKESTGNEEK